MTRDQLERRIKAIEEELARLKSKLESLTSPRPWWERIAGTFEGDAIYARAMELGRQYRRSLRADKSVGKRKPS